MSQWKGLVAGLLAIASFALARPASAAGTIVLPRAGQVGVGVQGQYGSLFGGDDLAKNFRAGPGLAVRMRYRMRYERAIGLSFESQSMEADGVVRQPDGFPTQPDSAGFDRATVTTAGAEFYQMFGTRTRTVRMLSIGAGIAQINGRLTTGETVYPVNNEGFYASLGAGVERFFYRSWAFDVSTRYMAVFHEGAVNHDVQASVGLVFYASY
jgi:hypothetical protein